MSGRKKYSVLRDPVQGDVYLTHEEMSILDTREMQRMRGVRQLGTAYLVYPGALHTRFDHMIGSLHVTQQMIDAINLSFEIDPTGRIRVSDEEARVIRIAALVHDITHIPYGHSLEDQDGIFRRHDSSYRFDLMFNPAREIGARLAELGVREEVMSILSKGRSDGSRSIPNYWWQIISGTICSDILDYLKRDAYFTGLHLQVDPRVTSYFKIDRASGNLFIDLCKHDLLREDILSEMVRMLEARYYFSERVYYHHAKVASGAMIARAVELALRGGHVKEEQFYDSTDSSILDLLDNSVEKAEPGLRDEVQELLKRVRTRKLYKRACVFPRYENQDVQEALVKRFFAEGGAKNRHEVEGRIADMVRLGTGQAVKLMVYCPAQRMQLKEARTHVRWPGEEELKPLSHFSEHIPRLADLERSYRNLWKFYLFADTDDPSLLAQIRAVAEKEFAEATNAYSA
ncbi:MAG: HD superfamily phosphohydrolase [Planctomycetota bacterium]|jgi:HD superfamily phosphohydrolase